MQQAGGGIGISRVQQAGSGESAACAPTKRKAGKRGAIALFLPAGERQGQEDLEDWVKVRIGNAVFVAHIWRSQMSTASRDAFVVVPKISHSDISMHNKKAESR